MQTSSRNLKAAVIGAGFGGIAAAIRLQATGFRTTLLDRLDKPGGRAYAYHDDGFHFDAGPTVITAPDVLIELFSIAGKDMRDYIELIPVTPMYRLHWEDGETFDYYSDEERLIAEIERLAPQDVDGYRRYYRYANEVFEKGYPLCDAPFLSFWDMVRVAPDLIKVGAHRALYSKVASFFKSDRLRQAFSFNSLLIGGNPFRASSIYTLIHPLERQWGVYFAKGGTGALVAALVKLFQDIGGDLRLNADIDRIETKDARVVALRDTAGRRETFDLVVSNAEVTHTYQHLLRDETLVQPTARRLQRKDYSMSLFVTYFGTKHSYPKLAHHNVMFGKRYRGLLDDIFDRGVLADDFSIYLHAPCLTDPSLAPAGSHAYYALSPVPHLGKCPIDWRVEADKYGKRIVSYLDERYMPGLSDHIVTQRHLTPLDFKDRLKSHHGAAFSLEPTLLQSAYFRVHNRDSKINGLYFVGAGTHPGAGIPGVVGSAKATVGTILRDAEAGRFQPARSYVGTRRADAFAIDG